MPTLTHKQARQLYDRFGSRQDSQKFYEDAATDELVARSQFDEAVSVFEFGCGTGRFAGGLLCRHLPARARYLGVDVSTTMVELARQRLRDWPDRAEVLLTEGSVRLDVADNCCDRFVSNYVLDLLSEEDIRGLLAEAYRILERRGRLCLAGLAPGHTALSRILTWSWRLVHRLRPQLLGGCRPLDIGPFLSPERWQVEFDGRVCRSGIPSAIVVARVKK